MAHQAKESLRCPNYKFIIVYLRCLTIETGLQAFVFVILFIIFGFSAVQDIVEESLDTTGGVSASRDSLEEESFGERRNPPPKMKSG